MCKHVRKAGTERNNQAEAVWHFSWCSFTELCDPRKKTLRCSDFTLQDRKIRFG